MYEPRTPPYAHQQQALDLSHDREVFALLMEMGTGKTKVAIDTIAMMAGRGDISGALIIAPKGAYADWVDTQIPVHMPEGVVDHLHMWRGGNSAAERDSAARLMAGGFGVVVMNTEATNVDRAWDFAHKFLSSRPCMMVVDESTRIKNHRAQRTKRIIKLGARASVRRIMTGMPVTRSPLDVFSQFQFLRSGILGTDSYWGFRARYAVEELRYFHGNNSRPVREVVAYRNMEELQRRVAEHSFRVLKEDCLDLPPKVYMRRDIEMVPEQRRIYEDLRRKATSQLEGGTFVTATEAMTQVMRMHQVSAGIVTDEEGTQHELPESRCAAIMDLVEETGEPTIVWCAYRGVIPRVVAALSKVGRVVEYHGGTSDEDRRRAKSDFQDGTARFFVGTPHTGSMSLTLTAAPCVIYHSNVDNFELRFQSEDRAHRIGQTQSVTYTDLVASRADERMIEILKNKISLAASVTGDSLREWLV